MYARKVQRRAGLEVAGALAALSDRLAALTDAGDRDERFKALGELLFAVVAAARELKVDPELALRAAADRLRAPDQPKWEDARA
jgi:XTP/dITP diphosphohydrolase/tetrapyrrole methylase family protein/MazG family protein/ATP diphosphatase